MNQDELRYTYENMDGFQTVPTFGTTMPNLSNIFENLLEAPGMPEFNPMMLLHGHHKITFHSPYPVEGGSVCTKTIVRDILDKKSGALLVLTIESQDTNTNTVLCTNECSLFIRGIGNFGGRNRPIQPDTQTISPPTRAPNWQFQKKTTANQAIHYRLCGDYNPIHIDPNMAAIGGFDRPILHGLCTLGITCFGIVREILQDIASEMISIEGRFTAAVIPGEVLTINVWKQNPKLLLFETLKENGKVCISQGMVQLKNAATSSKM
nr:hydroxysteroid 17-beta dehydrogenase 4 [Nephromyces sp. MMRI]